MDADARIDLHDSEIEQAGTILSRLQQKYAHRQATFTTLTSLKNEAEEEFRKIGLEVVVDWSHEPPANPQITVIDRITPFDPERQNREAEQGFADEFWKQQRKLEEQRHKERKQQKDK